MISIKNVKKGKYQTKIFYGEKEIDLENEIIFHYKIKKGSHFDEKTWNEIIALNNEYYLDRICLNKLKRKLTEKELRVFLIDNNANSSIIEKLITKYKKYKFIDDLDYTKSYIEYKKIKEGPLLIEKKLVQKGIEKNLIKEEIKFINEYEIIRTKIKQELIGNKKYSKTLLMRKILINLYQKGYNVKIAEEILDEEIKNYEFDDFKIILSDYKKLILKYEKKIQDKFLLEKKIKEKLYQKGYKKEDIEKIKQNHFFL